MGGGGGGRRNCICLFGEMCSGGGSDAEKRSNHQNKRFFMNNSVEALIPFNEGYQSLLKVHVPFFRVGEKLGLSPTEGIFFEM